MTEFSKTLEVRWSDLDPNFHVLHSKYYDFGAYCRMAFLVENGLSQEIMHQHTIGPILFREECNFRKEIRFGDPLRINVVLTKATQDYSRWSMMHELWKNDHTLAAIIHVDGAWMDTRLRKLATPPPVIQSIFEAAPRAATFTHKEASQ